MTLPRPEVVAVFGFVMLPAITVATAFAVTGAYTA